MAKKTVKTKAKAKPKTKAKVKAKPQAPKAVVKKEPVAKVINKPLPSKIEKKEKISKILLFVSLGLVLGAFLSLLAPAMNLEFVDHTAEGKLLGTGTIISLLTFMLSLPCKVICNPVNGLTPEVDVYQIREFGKKAAIPSFIQFVVIAVLVALAIAVFVLMLRKKYKGLTKLILSIAFWALLVLTVGSMFFEKSLVNVTGANSTEFKNITINETSIGLAPILYIVFGGCALGTSIVSFVLDRN